MKRILTNRSHRIPGLLLILVLVFISCSCARLPRRRTASADSPLQAGSTIRINLNRASIADLQKLPGVGKILADRIVNHREKYGAFRRKEHLMMVQGISEQKFLALQSLIELE